MSITYTKEAIGIIYELEERLDANRVFIGDHIKDEDSQGFIDELASNSYSMYKVARFILDGMRESATGILNEIEMLENFIRLDMFSSGFDLCSLDDTGEQTPDEE